MSVCPVVTYISNKPGLNLRFEDDCLIKMKALVKKILKYRKISVLAR